MEDEGWIHPESSEIFPSEVLELDNLSIATLTVDGSSEEARDLLLDPLPILAKRIDGVDMDWSVTVHRVNAEAAAGPTIRSGPRKLVILLLIIASRRLIVAIAYRITE
jgi:hypothetical protein